jgi:hypothetical protein
VHDVVILGIGSPKVSTRTAEPKVRTYFDASGSVRVPAV